MSIVKKLANIFKSNEKLVEKSINECDTIITNYIVKYNINRNDIANLITNINAKDYNNEPNFDLLIKLFQNIYNLSQIIHEDIIYDLYYKQMNKMHHMSPYKTNSGHIINISYWILFNYFVNYKKYSYTIWKSIYDKQLNICY